MILLQLNNRGAVGLFLLFLFAWPLQAQQSADKSEQIVRAGSVSDGRFVAYASGSDQVKQLLKERCELLNKLLAVAPERYKVGSIHYATLAQIQRDTIKATLNLDIDGSERLEALKKYQKATEDIWKCVDDRAHVGIANLSQADLAKVLMLEAQLIVLAQSKPRPQNELKRLLKERAELLHKMFDGLPGQYKKGVLHLATVVQIGDAVKTNLLPEMDSADRLVTLKKFEQTVEQLARDAEVRYQTGLTNCLGPCLTKVILFDVQLAVLMQPMRTPKEESEVKELRKKRRDLLARTLTVLLDHYKAGTASITQVLHAERDVLKANLDADVDPGKRVADFKKGLETAEATLKLAETRFKVGIANVLEVDQVRAALLDIRIDLLREEVKASRAP